MTTHLTEKLKELESHLAAANAAERRQVARRMQELLAGADRAPARRTAQAPESAMEVDLFDNVPV